MFLQKQRQELEKPLPSWYYFLLFSQLVDLMSSAATELLQTI
jgi:hypothetical protein